MSVTQGRSVELVGFGEAMVLFQPPAGRLIEDADVVGVQVAGAEFNLCAAAARSGIRTAWCSRIGADPLGRVIRRHADALGLDTSLVTEDENRPTGLFLKDVHPDGERRVFYYRSGSAASALAPIDAERALSVHPSMVALSGITLALGDRPQAAGTWLLRQARKRHIRTAFDPNLRPALGPLANQAEVTRSVLPWIDVLVLGLDEAGPIFGTQDPAAVFRAAADAGVAETVLKAGADGCYVYVVHEGVVHLPSAADNVIDPVGAGDAFAGGYLAARLRGAAVQAAAQFASLFAAAVISAPGDTAGLPSIELARQWLTAAGAGAG